MGSFCTNGVYTYGVRPERKTEICSNKRIRQLLRKQKKKRVGLSKLYKVRQSDGIPRFTIRRGSLHDNAVLPGFMPMA